MRVLITGATGFLGKYLIDEFAKNNCEIIAFGRNVTIGQTLTHCTFVKGDLCNYQDICSATKNVDCVIHAGALSTVWGEWDDFEKTNVLGTQNVAKACLANEVSRLVFVSSPSIYTDTCDKFDIHESNINPDNRLNNYIRSKIAAEKVIAEYNSLGLYAVIIRPRGLFGIGDTSIIPRLIKANAKFGVPLINEGKNIVDITYVANVAYAIYLSAISEEINGRVFNVTNGEPREFKDIMEELFAKIDVTPKYLPIGFHTAYALAIVLEFIYRILNLKSEPPLTKYIVCTLGTSQTLNIERAKNDLGYQAKKTLQEGIDIYAKWWKENH